MIRWFLVASLATLVEWVRDEAIYWYRRIGGLVLPRVFKFEAIIERAARDGSGWHMNDEAAHYGFRRDTIFCQDGYCVLAAIIRQPTYPAPHVGLALQLLEGVKGVKLEEATAIRVISANDNARIENDDGVARDRAYMMRRLDVKLWAEFIEANPDYDPSELPTYRY